MKYFTKLILSVALLLSIVDANSAWIPQASNTTADLYAIYATSGTQVYTVGQNGVGRKTLNGGTSWDLMDIISTPFNLSLSHYSIKFSTSSSAHMVGEFQDILSTSNSGSTWITVGDGGVSKLFDGHFFSSSSGWVVGEIEDGYGFLYNPFTLILIKHAAAANKNLKSIFFVNGSTGWIVGDGGVILKSVNSGTSWTQQPSSSTNDLNKVMFFSTTNGIAVGNNGTILRTTDGGATWSKPSSGTTNNLNGIYWGDQFNVWVCGNGGIILRSSDGGTTWSAESSGTTNDLTSIHGISVSTLWACGKGGKILKQTVPLPLQLINFSAEKTNQRTILRWLLVTDEKYDVLIERSENGAIFKPIGQLKNQAEKSNLFVDKDFVGQSGIIYYRIKISRQSGFIYSNVIKLNASDLNEFIAFPNPSPEHTNLNLMIVVPNDGFYDLVVLNTSGKRLLQKKAMLTRGRNTLQFTEWQRFSTGIYSILVMQEYIVAITTVIKQ